MSNQQQQQQQQQQPPKVQNKIITTLNVNRRQNVNSFQENTPNTPCLMRHSKDSQQLEMADKTPTINVNSTNLFSIKTNHQHHGHHKVQTPSPSRHTNNSHHQHKQQIIYQQQQQQTSDDNSNADAPPKPPRRPLPKINFT